ncbi:MAG: phosphatidylglycerophosphatase A [Ignavibacteriae bacterium]|nr:MAG: phosphatidylglycerophosphatase A [Ignavibacteriota bacterium]
MNFDYKKFIGSGFYTGYIPFAPGTFGSLAAALFLFIPELNNLLILIPIIIFSTIYGITLGNYFETIYKKDPKQFTLDEFVGTWIAYLYIPSNFQLFIITFIVWRFFDIVKIYPANKLESLKGGYGIMADDIVSGLYSLIFMIIFKLLFF